MIYFHLSFSIVSSNWNWNFKGVSLNASADTMEVIEIRAIVELKGVSGNQFYSPEEIIGNMCLLFIAWTTLKKIKSRLEPK